MRKKRESMRGITLIALVVTIVVLLILAGISISVLSGDNGIISQAQKSKEETEISEEKEIIDVSVAQAVNADVMGNLERNKLQEKLNSNAGNGVTEVMDSGDTLVVKFIEKNRYYEIDKDGKTEGPKELIKDDNAGDISKGGNADGSENNPFQINCIEDLVEFSMMVNGGNAELVITSNQFKDQYVALMRTLDFKSIFSYNDYKTTKYGDLNTDGIVEDIKTELTKTEEGCIGFTPIGIDNNRPFLGTFDGKKFQINNIYINYENSPVDSIYGIGKYVAALFGYGNASYTTIRNLEISGNIKGNGHAAGIIIGDSKLIENCKNYANIVGYNMVAGIIAFPGNGAIIENCVNYGTINITGRAYAYGGAGGIVGGGANNVQISNSINEGIITGNDNNIGGIIGRCSYSSLIYNCRNKGKTDGAGILGFGENVDLYIINCYNIGECKNAMLNGMSGSNWSTTVKVNIENCYNLGKCSNAGAIGTQATLSTTSTLNIENYYNAGISSKGIIGTIYTNENTVTTTNITNTYYDTTKSINIGAHTEGIIGLTENEIKNNLTFIETLNNNIGSNTNWKNWKTGEDGYPTFE